MIEIRIKDDRREYAPGEFIEGTVKWSFDSAPDDGEICLRYRTEGRGTRDSASAEELSLPISGLVGETPFRFSVPEGPYTFDGALISLRWYLDARVGGEHQELPVTVSPWVKVLKLEPVKEPGIHDLLAQVKAQQEQQQQ